jgi:hypothetical protein
MRYLRKKAIIRGRAIGIMVVEKSVASRADGAW